MSKSRRDAPAFVEMLSRIVACGTTTAELVVGLDDAVERLYDGKLPRRHYTEDHKSGCGCSFFTKTFMRKARREILERTEGQPFRIDTTNGPIFAERALWYFAGCSGSYESGPEGPKERPTWDGDAMMAVRS